MNVGIEHLELTKPFFIFICINNRLFKNVSSRFKARCMEQLTRLLSSFRSKAGGSQLVVSCNPFFKLTFSYMQYSQKKIFSLLFRTCNCHWFVLPADLDHCLAPRSWLPWCCWVTLSNNNGGERFVFTQRFMTVRNISTSSLYSRSNVPNAPRSKILIQTSVSYFDKLFFCSAPNAKLWHWLYRGFRLCLCQNMILLAK